MRRQAGHSLMEMLVSVAIIAFVLQIAGNLVVSANRHQTAMTRMIEEQTDIVAARAQLRSLIGSIVWTKTQAGKSLAFTRAGNDVLSWRTVTVDGDLADVTLTLVPMREDGPLNLTLESLTMRRDATTHQVLLSGVQSGGFRYFGPVDDQTGPAWHTSWTHGRPPPHLIELELGRTAGYGPKWPTLTIEIKVSDPG